MDGLDDEIESILYIAREVSGWLNFCSRRTLSDEPYGTGSI
jgi:hypothetical protein